MKLSAATAVSTTADESLVYLADYDENATTFDTKSISVNDLTTQIVASSQMALRIYGPIIQTLAIISSNFLVSENSSARSFDDVAIADGVTVTVPSTSIWSIL